MVMPRHAAEAVLWPWSVSGFLYLLFCVCFFTIRAYKQHAEHQKVVSRAIAVIVVLQFNMIQ